MAAAPLIGKQHLHIALAAASWPKSPLSRSWSSPIRMVIMILVMQPQTLTMSLQAWRPPPPPPPHPLQLHGAAARRRTVRCPVAPPSSGPASAASGATPTTRRSAASRLSGQSVSITPGISIWLSDP